MKVVTLDESLERAFWNHVNQEPLNYYFFVFDWKMNRDQTKILLVIEGEEIEGLMLIYRDDIVQLRGKRGAVKLLLDQLSLEKVELQAPLDCEDIALRKYTPKLREEMMLMRLRNGEERFQITTAPMKLGVEDAEEAAELLQRADPVWWSEFTAERLRQRMGETLWLGIKQNQKLASVGSARLLDFGSHIGVVATHEQYRNRGYATSIVSALVKEGLKVSRIVLIHVLSHNAPAIRVYSKVGFAPYKTYLSIRT